MSLLNVPAGKDVPNDLSMLGTHKMFGQTKGNARDHNDYWAR